MKLELNELADLLKVHPRTILRHITGEANPYWTDDHNPEIDLDVVALVFDCDVNFLKSVLDGKNKMLTQKEGARFLDIPVRKFRYRKYKTVLRAGTIVRYSQYHLANENAKRFG